METSQLNWIPNCIWGIADDVLRDLHARGKYRDSILPMTVPRPLDSMLETSKPDVLAMKANLAAAGIVHQDSAPRQAAGQAFYNTSPFTMRILDSFEFRHQIQSLSCAGILALEKETEGMLKEVVGVGS